MSIRYNSQRKTNHMINIASYLLVFAILSNIIYLPCYFYMRQINRSNIIEHHQYRLNNGMRMLDSSIDSILSLGVLLSEDSSYNEIHYKSDMDNQVLHDLQQLTSIYLTIPYDFIADFGMTQSDKILFNKHELYYDREYLTYDYYFQCDDENYLDYFQNTYCILPAMHFSTTTNGEYDAITFGYRCSAINNRYLFVHYPTELLADLFVEPEALESNYIAIYYKDTLLASSGQMPAKGSEVLTAASDMRLGIEVRLHLSESYIEQDLKNFNHLVLLFVVILLFASGLWIVLFSRQLTKPFNQISAILYETGHFHDESSKRNSIDMMVNNIRKMDVKLSDYSQIVSEQKAQNQIHILEKALYKGLYDESSRTSFLEAFPDFPVRWQLALIQYTSDDTAVELEPIQFFLTQYLHQNLPESILLPYSQDVLVAFLPAEQETFDLKEAQTCLEEQYSVSISCTVSPVYDNCTRLSEAFQQLEYESVTLQQTSSSTASKEDLPITIQQVQAIYMALQNGDSESAVSVLANASSVFLNDNRKDLIMAKCSYQMITYALIRLKLEHNNLLDIPIPNFKGNSIQKLFEEELPQCFTKIGSRLSEQRASEIQNLDQNILDFIDKNIGNQQLCISMVTDYFRISAPTLQKRMTSCVAKTFSAYVEDARMKKAHQLLQDTDTPIQKIAESVGYTNANSFYKAYKRYYGISPRSARQNGE